MFELKKLTSSEGEILPTPDPAARPQISSSMKQYETEVATPELVGTLLSDLGRQCLDILFLISDNESSQALSPAQRCLKK